MSNIKVFESPRHEEAEKCDCSPINKIVNRSRQRDDPNTGVSRKKNPQGLQNNYDLYIFLKHRKNKENGCTDGLFQQRTRISF